MAVKKTSKTKSKKASTSRPKKSSEMPKEMCKSKTCKHTGSCIYFLGFVGALVYYLSTAVGFWSGVLGVLKALVWPAMLVFKLLGL